MEEPGSDEAIAWVSRAELVAPTLIHAEVGNALWKRVQRRELVGGDDIGDRLSDLTHYVRTVKETAFLPRALQLAVALAHPIYDCIYLALAEALDDRLLTADRRFLNALEDTRYRTMAMELGG